MGLPVHGFLEGGEGDHLLGFGPALDADAHALVGLLHEERDLLGRVRAPAVLVLARDAGPVARLPVGSERGPVGLLRLGDQRLSA